MDNAVVVLAFAIMLIVIVLSLVLLRSVMRRTDKEAEVFSGTIGGVQKEYFYEDTKSSRSRQIIGVGIRTQLTYNFRIEKFDALDSLAVKFGFARRFYTGDADFDAQLYIYSENKAFYDAMEKDGELRQIILNLFQVGRATSLYYKDGKLIAGISPCSPLRIDNRKTPSGEPIGDAFSQSLHAILSHVAPIGADASMVVYTSSAKLDNRLKIALLTMLMAGVFAAFMCVSGLAYQMFDLVPMAILAAEYAIPVIIVSFFLLHRIMAESPYGADAFKSFVQCGIPAIPLWVFFALYAGNIYFDDQIPVYHQQRIVNKYFTTGRHNSHTYYVVVDDWHTYRLGTFSLRVPYNVYNICLPNRTLPLYSHPGALGSEWISLP